MDDLLAKRSIMRPPIVKGALADACLARFPNSALAPHIADLERLLMVTSSAPSALDGIPFGSRLVRSNTLVAVVRSCFSANAALGDMIRRVGPALKEDRVARGAVGGEEVDLVEAVREVVRSADPPARYSQPRY